MRKKLMVTMALGALIAVSAAGISTAETAEVGNLKFTADGKFEPKALPKRKLAPIALTAEGRIATKDGKHPPALREILLETDKNGTINVKGYPTCSGRDLQSRNTQTVRSPKVCKSAIIGGGRTEIAIELADSRPIDVKSPLTVFNGGVRGGTTTLFIHAFITVPVPAAVVTTVKIKRIKKGRYGLLSVAKIPEIAGGAGSPTYFKLKVDKKFNYKGKRVSVLTAKCPDGKLQAHATAVFQDKTRMSTDFVRPCAGRG